MHRVLPHISLLIGILCMLLSPASAATNCEDMPCCSVESSAQSAPVPEFQLKATLSCCGSKSVEACSCLLESSQSRNPRDSFILLSQNFVVRTQAVESTVLPEPQNPQAREESEWPPQEIFTPSQEPVSFSAFPNPPPLVF